MISARCSAPVMQCGPKYHKIKLHTRLTSSTTPMTSRVLYGWSFCSKIGFKLSHFKVPSSSKKPILLKHNISEKPTPDFHLHYTPKMTSPESKYSAVSDMDSESHENDSFLEKLSYQPARRQKRVWILHSILLLTSITLFTAAFVKYRQASECVSPVEPAYTREYSKKVSLIRAQN